jgi:FkbM family methyltransferase
MLQSTLNGVKEFVRCTRHNILHLDTFRLWYRRGRWHVSDKRVEMLFPWYPYLAFRDIEGYLKEGAFRPREGETVIDVGGCFGEFTLFASKCVGPTGRVIMLEPDPGNLARARELFELNGNPANIEIVTAGLWNQQGKLRFQTGLGGESAVVDFVAAPRLDDADSSKVIEIEVHSLPTLSNLLQLKRLDMVKMDVEGAELEIIAGASQLPPQLKPRYSIASYHIVKGAKTADTLAKLFPEMGYRSSSGFPQHLTTWAAPANEA